jgi:hypothetical protein
MNTISPAALRDVTLELYALGNDPPEGIRVIMNLDDITEIQAWLQGPGQLESSLFFKQSLYHSFPQFFYQRTLILLFFFSLSPCPTLFFSCMNHVEGTPYEGGRFKIKIQLSHDFPISPPQCKCGKIGFVLLVAMLMERVGVEECLPMDRGRDGKEEGRPLSTHAMVDISLLHFGFRGVL